VTLKHHNKKWIIACALVISGCAGGPKQPDWEVTSSRQLSLFGSSWLVGDDKRAELSFKIAQAAVASTGNLELAARLEIAKCGYMSAGMGLMCDLNTNDPIFKHASPSDQAYLYFINGDWDKENVSNLRAPYRDVVKSNSNQMIEASILKITDPVSRVIAASAAARHGVVTPTILRNTIDTCSRNGWKKPLLEWIQLALKNQDLLLTESERETYQLRIKLIRSSQ